MSSLSEGSGTYSQASAGKKPIKLRPKAKPTGSKFSMSNSSLSSASKSVMEKRLAEVRLERVKREQAFSLKVAKLKAEQAIFEAESDLATVQIRSEASQGLLDLEEPALSPAEKVGSYIEGLSPKNAFIPEESSFPHACRQAVAQGPAVSGVLEAALPTSLGLHASSSTVVHHSPIPSTQVSSAIPATNNAQERQALAAGVPLPSSPTFHGPALCHINLPSQSRVSDLKFASAPFVSQPPPGIVCNDFGFANKYSSVVVPSATAQSATAKGMETLFQPQVWAPSKEPTESNRPSETGKLADSQFQNIQQTFNEFAKILVRCQSSRTFTDDEKFNGDPLKYHTFIRKVQDRILSIHGHTDPGHALQLLLASTTGRARRLIDSCIMLAPDKALDNALQLLFDSFGSPAVAVKAHLKLVSEGPQIKVDECSLQDFYSDLINCKTVVEAAGSAPLLNTPTIAEGIFSRLPHKYQERFVDLAMRRGYAMEVVPFDLFIEFIDHSKRIVSSRLGKLLKPQNYKPASSPTTYRTRPIRAHALQNRDEIVPAVFKSRSVSETFSSSRLCHVCGSNSHLIWKCEEFCKMSISERKSWVKQKRLCFNCLRSGHTVSECGSKARCKTCQQNHHTLLHSSVPGKPYAPNCSSSALYTQSPLEEVCQGLESQKTVVSSAVEFRGRLQVLPVRIVNTANGSTLEVLALLDSGADTHLLSKRVYEELGLSGAPVKSRLQLADGSVKISDTVNTSLTVGDLEESDSYVLNNVRVMDQLPDFHDSIPSSEDLSNYQHLKDIDIPIIDAQEVDLLIGICTPGLHMFSEIRDGGSSGLWAGKSPLGWVLFGQSYPSAREDSAVLDISRVNLLKSKDLEPVSKAVCPCQLDFVDLVDEGDEILPSLDDIKATEIMNNSCKFEGGHYNMRLPWKQGCPKLPNNYSAALSRLKSLGRRLLRDSELLSKYQDKVNEMIQQGHAFEVTTSFDSNTDGRTWFIPHHCTGGKFRIVFDCAAEYEGTSLNQQLLQGPDNTNSLIGVLFRFRPHPVAVVGDIRNMFHQVNVDTLDQSALRFLWWEDGDPKKRIKVYQLTVHTFGLTSSPSIAGFALRRTAKDNRTNASNEVLNAIQRHLYVDDLLLSVESNENATALLNDLTELLASGGFQLAKQASNRREVLGLIPPDLLTPKFQEVDLQNQYLPHQSVLGLTWDPNKDQLHVKIEIGNHPPTRRGLLSVLASVYDPLGMVGPYVLPAKCLLQRLSSSGLGWDTQIAESDLRSWKRWVKCLANLNEISIPRSYANFAGVDRLELHCFADASSTGYGAVCYFRTVKNGKCACSFVIGKSRVAPAKRLSTPRLELCAAVIGVRLAKLVKSEHDVLLDNVTFWSDSTTVLAYLRDTSKRRSAFETNRINIIRKYSDSKQWRWVDTVNNPADLYSRGVSPVNSKKAQNWLNAPSFLFLEDSSWPQQPYSGGISNCNVGVISNVDDAEITNSSKEIEDLGSQSSDRDPLQYLTSRYSSLSSAVKTVAWLLRLKNLLRSRAADRLHERLPDSKCKNAKPKLSPIGPEEYNQALICFIRLAQQQAFPLLVEALEVSPCYEILDGKHGNSVKLVLQPLKKFCPMVDDDGVIRVGGRLQRSNLPKDFKHPIILPKRHNVTRLLVINAHVDSGHSGTQYVLNKLRDQYHIMGQARTVKYYIKRDCMVCRNQTAQLGSQLMAPLPLARVDSGRPVFEQCGVDFMGPIETKRGRSSQRRYCCLFTCLASRATHLEMVYTLSTDSFLMCLRRFLSARGHTTRVIISDNATNFIGAAAELRRGLDRLENDKVIRELSPQGIQWKHSPPLASHQGGIYEAIIRLVRKSMNAIMADRCWRSLSDEGFLTLLKEIEYILNGRPLTPVGGDVGELQALSPSMLLTGSTGTGLPSDVFVTADRLRAGWRSCQAQSDEFWRRWRNEYLTLLQRRQKWLSPQRNFQVGDLVLMLEENTPRNHWPKAVVEETFPDRDGLVRRVKVRCSPSKTFVRDIRKLCFLECEA